MGPDQGAIERDGRWAQPTSDFSNPPPQVGGQDTLDKKGIERPEWNID